MKFINPMVERDIAEGRALRLNPGTGGADPDGGYSVDHLELPGVDIVADLNAPLDLIPDNAVGEIVTSHTLEHIQNYLPLMHEIHRIVAPGGAIHIIVPHFSCTLGYSDPTHVRFFGLYSMAYFSDVTDQPKTHRVPAFYTPLRFEVRSVRIFFYDWGTFLQRRLGRFMTGFVNKTPGRQHFYESRLAYFYPADEMRYLLSPMKGAPTPP